MCVSLGDLPQNILLIKNCQNLRMIIALRFSFLERILFTLGSNPDTLQAKAELEWKRNIEQVR